MAAFSKEYRYDMCRTEAEHLLVIIKHYPSKDIAEYSRLVQALETFIKYGYFGEEDGE